MLETDRSENTSAPLYLTSTPRSGATLLAAMLNQHPHIAMFNEPWFFLLEVKYGSLRHRKNASRLLSDLAQVGVGFGAPVDRRLLQDIEDEIIASADSSPLAGFTHFLDRYAASRGKLRWGVKQPHGILDAPRLLAHQPNIRFVQIVRDARATVAYRLGKSEPVASDLAGVLRFARSWYRLCTFHRQVPALDSENYLEVRYEDLVSDPEATLRRICRFLGEDFDPAMLEFHKADQAYVPRDAAGEPKSTHVGVLQAVYTHEIDAWKQLLAPQELELIERVCADPMSEHRYQPAAGTQLLSTVTLAMIHLRLRWRLLKGYLRIAIFERMFHLGRRAVIALQPRFSKSV